MKKFILLVGLILFNFGVNESAMAITSPCLVQGQGDPEPCIVSEDIVDFEVSGSDINTGAVTSDSIADGSVTGTDLATGTVTSGNITDGTITGTDISDGSVGSDDITDGSVTGTDLATGTVTSGNIADGTVTGTDILDGSIDTTDIAAGAITDSEITGPISASKIEGLGGSEQVITVDAGGNGDYTTITDAMAAITPTSSNPYLIKVMPGSYSEGLIDVKSYVHIQGAGKDITNVYTTDDSDVLKGIFNIGNGSSNITISGMSIKKTPLSRQTILVTGSVDDIEFSDNDFNNVNAAEGIYLYALSSARVVIKNNTFTRNGEGYSLSVRNTENDVFVTVSNNHVRDHLGVGGIAFFASGLRLNNARVVFNNNTIYGGRTGINCTHISADIIGNVVNGSNLLGHGIVWTGTAGETGNIVSNIVNGYEKGIAVYQNSNSSKVKIMSNSVTNAGKYGLAVQGTASDIIVVNNSFTGSGTKDIYVDSFTTQMNLSGNLFDDKNLLGTVTGLYNVTSAGAEIAVP